MEISQGLIQAAKTNDILSTRSYLAQLQSEGYQPSTVLDEHGSGPLHWTAAKGHTEIAVMLLEAGFPPSTRNGTGDTPLHWATLLGNAGVASALLRFGADTSAKNNHGTSPVDLDTTPEIKQILADAQADWSRPLSVSSPSGVVAPPPAAAPPAAPTTSQRGPPPAIPPPRQSLPPTPAPAPVQEDEPEEEEVVQAAPAFEFRDEQEEREFQKMVIHFGHEKAMIALLEVRRVKDKKKEEDMNKKGLISLEEAQKRMKENMVLEPVPVKPVAKAPEAVAAQPTPEMEEKRNKIKEERAKNRQKELANNVASDSDEAMLQREKTFREDAEYDYVDGLKDAVEKGINIDAVDEEGNSALLVAALLGNKKSASFLLKNKCKKNLKNKKGETALYRASAGNFYDVVKTLLKAKVRVDPRDREGRTPLMIASMMGYEDIVEELIKAGANVNHVDKTKKTALILASYSGFIGPATALLDYGAYVDFADQFGWTALMLAAYNNQAEMAGLLLDRGANTKLVSSRGKTALELATEANAVDVLEEFKRGKSRKKSAKKEEEAEEEVKKKPKKKDSEDAPKEKKPKSEKKSKKSSSLPEDVSEWTEDDVGAWLGSLSSELSQYTALFKENNMNGKRLLRLTDDKLKSMGVTSLGIRDDILTEIEDLKK